MEETCYDNNIPRSLLSTGSYTESTCQCVLALVKGLTQQMSICGEKGKSRIFVIVCFLQIVFLLQIEWPGFKQFFKIHGFSIDKFVGWIEVELKAPARPRLHVLHPVFTSLKTGGRSTYVKGPTNLAIL